MSWGLIARVGPSVLVPLAAVAVGGLTVVLIVDDRRRPQGKSWLKYRLAIGLPALALLIAAWVSVWGERDGWWAIMLFMTPAIFGLEWLRYRIKPDENHRQDV